MSAKKPATAIPDEAKWVALAQKGDRDAYRHLVEGYQDRLFGLVLSMVSSREQAEDLAQEIFVKAFFALPRFEGGSAFYTWLFRIGANHCLDHLRKRKLPEVSMDATLNDEDDTTRGELIEAPTSDSPDSGLEKHSEGYSVLQSLDPEQRLILTLRELEGYSYEDLSRTLKIRVNTIKSRLNRAREALKEAFRREYGNIPVDKAVQVREETYD